MARKRIKLAFIVDAAARKATYIKRSNNILKKVYELCTLCDIEACAIIYGPYQPEPEIWPSAREVENVISKFRAKPEFEQTRKKLSQEDYLKHQIVKADDQLKKMMSETKKYKMKVLMYEYFKGQMVLENIPMNDLNDFYGFIDHNVKDIDRRMEVGYTDNNGQGQVMTASTSIQLQHQMAPPPPPPPPPAAATSSNDEMAMMVSHGHVGMAMQNEFMDLMNGNGDEAIPFGQPHTNIQDGFWHNLLP